MVVSGGVESLNSYAPMSQTPPLGRATPRWSVAGQVALLAVLIAGLPASRAWVSVAPPLLANGPSSGSTGLAAGANLVVVDAIGDAAGTGAVADQVVRTGGDHGAADVIAAGSGGIEVAGHNRVAQGDRRRVLRKATACPGAVVVVVGGVVG